MTRQVIGCDPGLTGALARIDDGKLMEVVEIPTNAKGARTGTVKNEVNAAALSDLLREWSRDWPDDAMFVIERVGAMPGQGIASTMSLGDTIGCIRGVVAARGYPLHWVTPQRWKKHYGLQADKELARARAIELYPGVDLKRKKDHGKAEAILIARYGWEALR
jgi:crossover junction endodeoxyribonuclease RuvC